MSPRWAREVPVYKQAGVLECELYLLNAFSLNFFAMDLLRKGLSVRVEAFDAEYVAERSDIWTSGIGHQSTADLLTSLLGVEVEMNRVSVSLNAGDQVLVAQYKGPRLSEGATELPEGSELAFLLVTVA